MNKPIAVIINDVHYSLPTLEVADAAVNMAINKANALGVPLIVAGDLHETKANLRGECVEVMRRTFKRLQTKAYVIIGNHDLINEKSDKNALEFLDDLVELVRTPSEYAQFTLIPYQHSPAEFKSYLDDADKAIPVIMHQGVHGSLSGEYVQDKSAIPKEWLDGYRVISGHYHTRQDIECGETGLLTYTGNPYTLNFGEAKDPAKGFHVLFSSGLLQFTPTNLRKHVVINITVEQDDKYGYLISSDGKEMLSADDIVKVKVMGPKEYLSKSKKEEWYPYVNFKPYGTLPFKLELIPLATKEEMSKPKANIDYDSLIDEMPNTSLEQKERLKTLWKTLCE